MSAETIVGQADPVPPLDLLKAIDGWLANTCHDAGRSWRVSIAQTLKAQPMSGGVTLDSDELRVVRFALLVGLQSFGEIERLINRGEAFDDRLPEGMRPMHPTGDAETVSKFAEALVYLEPAWDVAHG